MVRQILDDSGLLRSLPFWLRWAGVATVAIALMLVIEYFETAMLFAGIQFEELFVFKLLGYANLLLIASTVLYISHLWFTSEEVGRWASRLAGFGALAALIALSTRWFETYYLFRPGHIPLSSMYEVIALFSAITVVIYLIMERIYRTRSAGAFVMLIVLAAVMYQIWLATNEQAIPGSRIRVLKSYWTVFCFLGVNAFWPGLHAAAAAG